MRAKPLVRFWLVVVFIFLTGKVPADAWPKEAYRAMVYDTLRLLPPRLSRVLLKREAAILRGVRSLEGERRPCSRATAYAGGSRRISSKDVETRIEQVVRMVGEHNSFDDTAYELGRLLRIAADLADPVIVGAGRRDLQRVAPELYQYVDLNLTKFPLVHDGALFVAPRGSLDRAPSCRSDVGDEGVGDASLEGLLARRPDRVGRSFDFRSRPLRGDIAQLFTRRDGGFLSVGSPPGRKRTAISPDIDSPRISPDRRRPPL